MSIDCRACTRRSWRASPWRWRDMLPGRPLQHAARHAPSTGCSSPWRRRSCSGAAGRSSSAAGQSVRAPQPEHVHADRPGRRGRVRSTASSRRSSPEIFPHGFRDARRRVARLLRGGRGDHRAGAARPGAGAAGAQPDQRAPSARCWAWRRRRRAGSRADGREEDVPLDARAAPAIGCGCGPARRCPSTASSSRGRSAVDESMITGEPIPVEKGPGDEVIGGTVNGTGSFLMRAERVGARHAAGADRPHGRRGPAQPRPDRAAGRRGRRPGSCPAVLRGRGC